MAIKKAFQPIVDFLETNKDSKVKSIMQGVMDLCSAKSGGGGGSTFVKNDAGVVTHVFCYYHKKWEEVGPCEFGAKASSPTGFNSMCKIGTSEWTKQQRAAKKANEALLASVASGEVAPGDIAKHQADIEVVKGIIVARPDGLGSATI